MPPSADIPSLNASHSQPLTYETQSDFLRFEGTYDPVKGLSLYGEEDEVQTGDEGEGIADRNDLLEGNEANEDDNDEEVEEDEEGNNDTKDDDGIMAMTMIKGLHP